MSKIIAYACSTRQNALWSAAQFDNAAPKNRAECDIPLVAASEANAFKAKSIARGKLLERFRCHVQEVVEHAEDEGDRVYFGTSNHFEYLKEIADEMDMWGWDAVIRERDEVDPYADLRKVRDENRALIEERARLRELIATFMIRNSFATGHGDTIDDLLNEFQAQLDERRVSQATEGREP